MQRHSFPLRLQREYVVVQASDEAGEGYRSRLLAQALPLRVPYGQISHWPKSGS